MSRISLSILLPVLFLAACGSASNGKVEANKPGNFSIIAYYSGNNILIDSFPIEKLTHIIFSFCHLKGNNLAVDNAADTTTIQKLVSLKSRNAQLKVILSLGGWGGCEFCSPVFSTDIGRKDFARSTKQLLEYFQADGIDLDWEYPAIEGYPGHAYKPEDKPNFTALVKTLRDTLGSSYEINFAAGGFDIFLQQSIEWANVMPLLDKINLMSYDLVNGYSRVTGHHTPLYSTSRQKESADNAIRYLDSIGVPLHKVIIGAAFYARQWDSVANISNGQYQPGKFHRFIPYNRFSSMLSTDSGFIYYTNDEAKAAYAYSPVKKQYATFDDPSSIRAKTKYAMEKGLGGIMFWELTLDKQHNGLLDVIDKTVKEK